MAALSFLVIVVTDDDDNEELLGYGSGRRVRFGLELPSTLRPFAAEDEEGVSSRNPSSLSLSTLSLSAVVRKGGSCEVAFTGIAQQWRSSSCSPCERAQEGESGRVEQKPCRSFSTTVVVVTRTGQV